MNGILSLDTTSWKPFPPTLHMPDLTNQTVIPHLPHPSSLTDLVGRRWLVHRRIGPRCLMTSGKVLQISTTTTATRDSLRHPRLLDFRKYPTRRTGLLQALLCLPCQCQTYRNGLNQGARTRMVRFTHRLRLKFHPFLLAAVPLIAREVSFPCEFSHHQPCSTPMSHAPFRLNSIPTLLPSYIQPGVQRHHLPLSTPRDHFFRLRQAHLLIPELLRR